MPDILRDCPPAVRWLGPAGGLAFAVVGLAGLLPGIASRPAFAPAWGFALAFCLACLHRIGRIMLFLVNDHSDLPFGLEMLAPRFHVRFHPPVQLVQLLHLRNAQSRQARRQHPLHCPLGQRPPRTRPLLPAQPFPPPSQFPLPRFRRLER